MLSTPPFARVRGASKRYAAGVDIVHALENVDLDISAGEVLSVVGVSGSGKSTLLNVLAGLIALDSGEVVVGDTRLDGKTFDELAAYRRSSVSLVYQEYNLLPMLDVLSNVALPGRLRGENDEDARAAAVGALRELGLDSMGKRYPGELSGGQRQRVAIARALAGRQEGSRLLLADEPTGSLDRGTGAVVIEALRAAADRGLAVVIATHDPLVRDSSDAVVYMSDGVLSRASRVESA